MDDHRGDPMRSRQVSTRYRLPNTNWSMRRGPSNEVIFEEWAQRRGKSAVVSMFVISAADWVDGIAHVSPFGDRGVRERAMARAGAEAVHRGDDK